MRLPTLWPTGLLALLIAGLDSHWLSSGSARGLTEGAQWTSGRKLAVRDQVRALWHHGFDSYMRFGKSMSAPSHKTFPLDELAPLSCTGRGPNWHNPADYAANDVAGNFSVTLVDALDTFVVLNDPPGFEEAVRKVIRWVSFDVNTKPQVFETTIRILGGLLSGHIYANKTGQPFHLPWYRGELLDMAHDLGLRLLPAFSTPTGMPYARINLRHGVPKGESIDSCTAGAGSLILEFGTLSRLTGDDRFEKAAYKAFFALWNRRSDIGLVGNTVNIFNGHWLHPEVNGIGAGIDSFYEYALKWYIMSGEVEFLDVWQESYASVMRYSRSPDGYWYRSVNIFTGDAQYSTVDSLSAFWPGLQVLGGDIENAIKAHLVYWNLWRGFAGLPEVWDMNFRTATAFQYPLRPEFVESTWYLYRATRDPFYLDVGARILHDITRRSKVDCGFAGIHDLRINLQDDRMESFALSETLKYLYLLFDEDNPLHSDDSQWVFTTEGHILTLEPHLIKPISSARKKLRGVENNQCPAYQAPMLAWDDWDSDGGLRGGIQDRADIDYTRELVGRASSEFDQKLWTPDGWCLIPKHELYTYDFVLSQDGRGVPEDLHPSSDKMETHPDGYIVHNVTGIRVHIVSRLDGKGYDITKLGPYAVKTGQKINFNDSTLATAPVGAKVQTTSSKRTPEVGLRLYLDYVDPMLQLGGPGNPGMQDVITETNVVAATALFAGDPAADPPLRFGHGHGDGVRVVRFPDNPLGCSEYSEVLVDDEAIVVDRGECTFLEKLIFAQRAGASGVVVLSNEEHHVNPSAERGELEAAGPQLNDVAVVVLRKSDADQVAQMLDAAERLGLGTVKLVVEPSGSPAEHRGEKNEQTQEEGQSKKQIEEGPIRVLYLNNHPLLNTRLIV
ncbi:alpha-mannosidase [Dichomitus squalens LYAD-421 SS1]|uniref:alpha-mannosidase n=1 Tax=Dichomitus squalens (strain LYAD-421) TaxID=732165 RepID=UPI000441591A|nr:alpha-mannosidase [Dichomitus squalens LYAD-421 SS1]EJF62997.1 alpha-mannosidase [Dichomitus squalens LYAD-421 SS1]